MATPRSTSRRPLALVRRTAVVLVGAVGIGLAALPAQAAPAPATSGDAATLMAARAHDLEKVTEAFNAARDELATQEATARAAAATVQQARAVQAAARQQVRGIARSAYTGQNGALKALLTSKNADDFIGQVSTLQSIAGHRTAVLDQAVAAGRTADQAQAQAAKAVAAARATYDSVAHQQAGLQTQVNQYQADFDRLSATERQAAIAAAETVDVRASRDDRTDAGSTASGTSGTSGAGGSAGSAPAAPAPAAPVAASSQAAQIAVNTALAQRGKPYVWAAAGPRSFDCSGLMQYAYAAAGVSLPHSSLAQSRMGTPVARNALQPGDLVFFYSPVSHVGMYIGNGNMVNAPTAGDVVKVIPLASMPGYVSARRLVH
jgi:cell wall-associated NlpC family hydrolase